MSAARGQKFTHLLINTPLEKATATRCYTDGIAGVPVVFFSSLQPEPIGLLSGRPNRRDGHMTDGRTLAARSRNNKQTETSKSTKQLLIVQH